MTEFITLRKRNELFNPLPVVRETGVGDLDTVVVRGQSFIPLTQKRLKRVVEIDAIREQQSSFNLSTDALLRVFLERLDQGRDRVLVPTGGGLPGLVHLLHRARLWPDTLVHAERLACLLALAVLDSDCVVARLVG